MKSVRRMRVICLFPQTLAPRLRLVSAVPMERSENWQTGKVYPVNMDVVSIFPFEAYLTLFTEKSCGIFEPGTSCRSAPPSLIPTFSGEAKVTRSKRSAMPVCLDGHREDAGAELDVPSEDS